MGKMRFISVLKMQCEEVATLCSLHGPGLSVMSGPADRRRGEMGHHPPGESLVANWPSRLVNSADTVLRAAYPHTGTKEEMKRKRKRGEEEHKQSACNTNWGEECI
jgi:hypothetical protein